MNRPSDGQTPARQLTLSLPDDFVNALNAIAASHRRRPSRLLADTLLIRQSSLLQDVRDLAALQHHVLSLRKKIKKSQ